MECGCDICTGRIDFEDETCEYCGRLLDDCYCEFCDYCNEHIEDCECEICEDCGKRINTDCECEDE